MAVAAVLPLAFACGEAEKPPPPGQSMDPAQHRAEVLKWRSDREARLRSDDGWLTLAGLYWLKEGTNSFGSADDVDLVFPAAAPELAGVLRLEGSRVALEPAEGVQLSADGAPAGKMELRSDLDGEATVLELGSLLFHVIDRGGRLGVRLKDRQSATLRDFEGMQSLEISPRWRLTARFEAYDEPRTVSVPNIIGTDLDEIAPGLLHFDVDGKTYTLEPTGEPGGRLFVVFGDATNGRETYGGGRFLYADWPDETGHTVLDFNRSYNPPCVFTPWATCPLPTPRNKLPIPITAGESTYTAAPPH
jgi:uncharacterized protein (DUF1684 family)